MIIFPSLLLLVALSISAVAAYYSIVGLTAIFAAAVIPIIVMGTVLEVGKIATTVWLHAYWNRVPIFSKIYLTTAVVILMFITSMGIFGFLSKSHIEQTALSTEQLAQIDTIEQNIERSESKISRWQEEIDKLNSGTSSRVDNLVAAEQETLDALYARIEKEKDDARAQADRNIDLQNQRLQQAADRKAQDIEAANGDTAKIEQARRNELGVASSAQREIRTIQATLNNQLSAINERYDPQTKEISERIGKLRTEATLKTEDVDVKIVELEKRITSEQKVLDENREVKFGYEAEYRILEAEVGPVKYIAEFIYGEADKNLLEEAVRWVIIIIVFVFDPLAIMLVLAATMTFEWNLRSKKKTVESVESHYKSILENLHTRLKDVNMELKDYEKLLEELDRQIEEGSRELSDKVDLESRIEILAKEKSLLEITIAELENSNKELADAIQTLDIEKLELIARVEELESIEPEVREVEVIKEVEVENTARVEMLLKQIADLQQDIDKRDRAVEKLAQKYELVEKARQGLTPMADDDGTPGEAGFGVAFPSDPAKGEVYLRVDFYPSRLYKWNGVKWIQVEKDSTDSYAHNDDYIEHVVEKLSSGEYDLEDLTSIEKERVEDLLNQRGELGK